MWTLLTALASPVATPEIQGSYSNGTHYLYLDWPRDHVRVVLVGSSVSSVPRIWKGLSPGDAIERVDVYCVHDELKGDTHCRASGEATEQAPRLESLHARLTQCFEVRPVPPEPELIAEIEAAWKATTPAWLVDPEQITKVTVHDGEPFPWTKRDGPTRAVDHAHAVIDTLDNPGKRYLVLHARYVGHMLKTRPVDCGSQDPADPPCLPIGVTVEGTQKSRTREVAILGPDNGGRGRHVADRRIEPWADAWEQVRIWNAMVLVGDERVQPTGTTWQAAASHARSTTGPESLGAWLLAAHVAAREPGHPHLAETVTALEGLLPSPLDPQLADALQTYRDIASGKIPVGDPCRRR